MCCPRAVEHACHLLTQTPSFLPSQNSTAENQLTFPIPANKPPSTGTSTAHLSKLHLAHRELVDTLNTTADRVTSSHTLAHIVQLIEAFVAELPGPVTTEQLTGDDCSLYIDWHTFACNEYEAVLNLVVARFDRNWPKSTWSLFQPEANYDFVIEAFGALSANRHKMAVCVPILESLIHSDTMLFSAFVDLSNNVPLPTLEHAVREGKCSEFVQLLVSLPNRVANVMQRSMPDVFRPNVYSGVLLAHWLKSVYFIGNVNHVEKRPVYNTTFLSALLSRILIDFHNNRSSPHIIGTIRILGEWAVLPVFNGMLPQIFLGLSTQAIDVVALFMLEHTASLTPFIAEAVLTSKDWTYCLTTAIPMQSYYSSDNLPKHLVAYLSQFPHLFDTLLGELLDVWSNKTCIQRASVEQRIYLTKLIVLMVTAKYNESGEKTTTNTIEIKRKLFQGVPAHIESQHSTIRCLGMICAEVVLGILDPNTEDSLKFDYFGFSSDDQLIVEYMRDISRTYRVTADCDARPWNVDAIFKELLSGNVEQKHNIAVKELLPTSKPSATIVHVDPSATSQHIDDLDSDDELEPYDMSNDLPESAAKAPLYLLDLKETLRENDDPDVFFESVRNCEKLVHEQLSNDDASLGLDILDLLIGLDNKFSMDDFEQCRMAGCVAIVSVYPKESSTFLCCEFHTKSGTYNIASKVLMLEILGATARELSKLTPSSSSDRANTSKPALTEMPRKIIRLDDISNRIKEAQQIIRQRVELKTRRFATRTAHPHKLAQRNRFADVAGHFFFPLLHGVGERQLTLTVHRSLTHDVDNVLLVTLLNTLASVTLASQNCPVVPKFAAEIFRLSITLRYSAESRIRLAVMQLIAVALLVTPKYVLKGDLLSDMCEIRIWLADCCQHQRAEVSSGILSIEGASPRIGGGESNEECRQMAGHVLALCLDVLE